MNVGELIKILEKIDPNVPVYTHNSDGCPDCNSGGFDNTYKVSSVTLSDGNEVYPPVYGWYRTPENDKMNAAPILWIS